VFSFFFSSRRRHTRSKRDWSSACALPILEGRPGTLIVGSSLFTVELAKSLKRAKAPVIVVDSSWEKLRHARNEGVPFYHGDMLSEQTEYNLDTIPYDYLLAATDYHSYNSLVCTTFIPEYGRTNVFKISPPEHEQDGNTKDVVDKVGGRTLFKEGLSFEVLNQKVRDGFIFRQTVLTPQYTYKQYVQEKDPST